MGKQLSLALFVVATAACGSDSQKPADAAIQIDAKVDAPKVFLDAPPPSYDFTCFGKPDPTTATDPVTINGVTETLLGQTPSPIGGVTVMAFKNGTATALDTKTSAADGTFTTGNLATGGTPLDGYIEANLDTYRTSFVFPPNKVVANLTAVPVPMITITQFGLLAMAGINQDDTMNGFLFVTVADCTLKPINGATLTVTQAGADVGQQVDLGTVLPALAGIYAVANTPDGDTTIGGSFDGMTFPTHVVKAFKKPNGNNAVGTVTVSAVVPGPF